MKNCLVYYKIRVARSVRDPKFILELAGFVVLFIYAIYTIRMYYANRDAADAARDAVTFARDSAHLDQRAWVAVVSIEGTPEVGKPWNIIVKARNTGRTFAENLHGITSAIPVPKGKSLDTALEEVQGAEQATPATVTVLAPGGDFENLIQDPGGAKINRTALDSLIRGDGTEFVHGRLSYKDVFGCSHWTEYCFSLGTNLKWVGCNEHNSADDGKCTEEPK